MLPLTVRIDADDTRSAEMLKQDGWREGDELTTYWKDKGAGGLPWFIRYARRNDENEVVKIANRAFSPKDKTAWVRDAFNRLDRTVLVWEEDKALLGFIILRDKPQTIVIDLIGVYRPRKHIGSGLVRAAEHYSRAKFIQAGTANPDAQHFYAALGFTVKHRRRTFHKP